MKVGIFVLTAILGICTNVSAIDQLRAIYRYNNNGVISYQDRCPCPASPIVTILSNSNNVQSSGSPKQASNDQGAAQINGQSNPQATPAASPFAAGIPAAIVPGGATVISQSTIGSNVVVVYVSFSISLTSNTRLITIGTVVTSTTITSTATVTITSTATASGGAGIAGAMGSSSTSSLSMRSSSRSFATSAPFQMLNSTMTTSSSPAVLSPVTSFTAVTLPTSSSSSSIASSTTPSTTSSSTTIDPFGLIASAAPAEVSGLCRELIQSTSSSFATVPATTAISESTSVLSFSTTTDTTTTTTTGTTTFTSTTTTAILSFNVTSTSSVFITNTTSVISATIVPRALASDGIQSTFSSILATATESVRSRCSALIGQQSTLGILVTETSGTTTTPTTTSTSTTSTLINVSTTTFTSISTSLVLDTTTTSTTSSTTTTTTSMSIETLPVTRFRLQVASDSTSSYAGRFVVLDTAFVSKGLSRGTYGLTTDTGTIFNLPLGGGALTADGFTNFKAGAAGSTRGSGSYFDFFTPTTSYSPFQYVNCQIVVTATASTPQLQCTDVDDTARTSPRFFRDCGYAGRLIDFTTTNPTCILTPLNIVPA